MDPVLRRGRILFDSSNTEKYPELSASTMTSCASCHPDGGTDGSAWSTMEGERRTMALWGGVRGRGWLHASGTHRDIREFAEIIVAERLGGDPSPADLDALATYVADGIPKLQSPVVDEALAARGQELFATHCERCHAGEAGTSGRPDPADRWSGGDEAGPLVFDVGTATSDAGVSFPQFFESLFGEREAEILALVRGDRDLGPGDPLEQLLDFRPRPERKAGQLKAPALTNVWHNALFFHDGRFDDLEDVVEYFDEHLSLGLSSEEKDALVEYLRTL
jgi:cytochrome c peroxidase